MRLAKYATSTNLLSVKNVMNDQPNQTVKHKKSNCKS